jgi:hypothetical protein
MPGWRRADGLGRSFGLSVGFQKLARLDLHRVGQSTDDLQARVKHPFFELTEIAPAYFSFIRKIVLGKALRMPQPPQICSEDSSQIHAGSQSACLEYTPRYTEQNAASDDQTRLKAVMYPSIGDRCGRHFRFRQFFEASETWELTSNERPFDNTPIQLATYDAIRALCQKVLDPVYEYVSSLEGFSELKLTYAFASPELVKRVRDRLEIPNINPNGDQHAGCEFNREGRPFCDRFGQAVDLICPGINSALVASWACQNTQFDRLYFYDASRPFHISAGPDNVGQIVVMRPRRSNPALLFPRRVTPSYFDELLAPRPQV